MSAIEFIHPNKNYSLIFHSDNSAVIRIETNPTYPGWIELGYTFNDHPVLIDTEKEWHAFVEMIELADQVQKRARLARLEYQAKQS